MSDIDGGGLAVAKSTIVKDVGQLEVWWNTRDHFPPHFHVKHKQEGWQIRVYFDRCTRDDFIYDFKIPPNRDPKSKPISSSDRSAIFDQMKNSNSGALMKQQLFEEWNEKVKIKDVFSK